MGSVKGAVRPLEFQGLAEVDHECLHGHIKGPLSPISNHSTIWKDSNPSYSLLSVSFQPLFDSQLMHADEQESTVVDNS
jgi:hypothetical protein